MSLHRFGVMKLYRATVWLARSVASSLNGRTWLMQFAELGSPLSVTSTVKLTFILPIFPVPARCA